MRLFGGEQDVFWELRAPRGAFGLARPHLGRSSCCSIASCTATRGPPSERGREFFENFLAHLTRRGWGRYLNELESPRVSGCAHAVPAHGQVILPAEFHRLHRSTIKLRATASTPDLSNIPPSISQRVVTLISQTLGLQINPKL